MEKILSLVVLGILIISGFGASALQETDKNVQQDMMSIDFSQHYILEKGQYVTMTVNGTNSILMRSGKPILPMYTKTFTFPFGTKIKSVECIPHNAQEQYISKEIQLAPMPTSDGSIGIENQMNEASSSIEDPFPGVWYNYDVGCGLDGNERCVFVKVQVFPVQYSLSKSVIKQLGNVDIVIDYEELEKTVLSDEEYDFIVLTPSEFSTELQPLIDHKNNRGISTKLVTLDEIYSGSYFPVQGRDNPEKIKYFIKDAIENWGTKNVLLVGGSDEFPARETHVYVDYNPNDPDYEVFVTDLYYADIYNSTSSFSSWDSNENNVFGEYNWDGSYDDVDLYPDVHIGRLACVDSDEVDTCVNKIITYETNEAYKQDWFTNIVVLGGDTSPGDRDDINEGEYVNQKVIDIMDGFIPTKCWASNGGVNTRSSINTALNAGEGFVDFSGHGNPMLWATHPNGKPDTWLPVGDYKNVHVSSLINGDKLPIVVTGACSVGKFDAKNNCFTWSFVSNPNGGGIGAFGTTGLSWGYDGTSVTYGLGGEMQLSLFKAYRDEDAITFGEMWIRALNSYISPRMDCGDYKTVEEWEPFGDPTLAIADESQPPVKPDAPKGPNSTGVNVEHTYTASTTDPEGDKIYYLFDWGDGKFSGWVGPYNSGQTAKASHVWTEKGDYQIRVKAKDDHGVQSEWSDPLPVTMPMNKQLVNTPFYYFLERLLHSFPILRNLCGL